ERISGGGASERAAPSGIEEIDTLAGAFGSMAERLVEKNRELEGKIEELQGALARIRTLSGLLPICASCKRIRDDKGYWNQLEAYLQAHSEAEFTHGICPECQEALYPGLVRRSPPSSDPKKEPA
ncbi:MAG: hypothetical protein AB1578_08995, partial [Thermodesulfobacteriota bacterium]